MDSTQLFQLPVPLIAIVGASAATAAAIFHVVRLRRVLASIGDTPAEHRLIGFGSLFTYLLPHIPWINFGNEFIAREDYKMFKRRNSDVVACFGYHPYPYWLDIYVADASIAREITSNRTGFPKPTEVYEIVSLYGTNVIASEHDEWKLHRRITAPSFSERNNRLVHDESTRLITDLFSLWSRQGNGARVEIDDAIELTTQFALMVIAAAGFGANFTWDDHQKPAAGYTFTFQKALNVLMANIPFRIAFSDRILGLWKHGRNIRDASRDFKGYMDNLIQDRKQQVPEDRRADLLSNLIAAADLENAEMDKNRSKYPFGDEELAGNVFVFLFAGHETTSNTLAFALSLLAVHQDVQQKMYDSLRELIPEGERPAYASIVRWSYGLAVIYETLRLHPPLPAYPKYAAEDTSFVTYSNDGRDTPITVVVPKGQQILIDIPGLHYNPAANVLPEELKFDCKEKQLSNWDETSNSFDILLAIMSQLSAFNQLPEELIEAILSYTAAVDVVSCLKTCRRVHRIVQASIHLQLILELAVEGLRLRTYPSRILPCGMEKKSPSDLLRQLKRSNEAWASQNPLLERNIVLPGSIYEIRDGFFAQTVPSETPSNLASVSEENDGVEVYSMWLEEDQTELMLWRRHPDLGLRVRDFSFEPTEDLLVLVESTPSFFSERAVRVHIRSLDTGLWHPQTRTTILGGDLIPLGEGCIIRSCGDTLAVMFLNPSSWRHLYIWNWKTGQQLYRRSDVCGYAYLSPTSFAVMLFQTSPPPPSNRGQSDQETIKTEDALLLQLFELSRINEPILLETLPKVAGETFINVFSDRLSIDSPNFSQDLPLSPFIRDETAERVVVIHYTSRNMFSFVLVRPLLRLLAEQNQHPPSSERRQYSWDEWSPRAAFCISSNDIDIGSTPICGSRAGFLCRKEQVFEEDNLGNAETMVTQLSFWRATMVGILDFNPRPVLRDQSRLPSSKPDDCEGSQDAVRRFLRRRIFLPAKSEAPPSRLRFFAGPPDGDYHDMMLDWDHMAVVGRASQRIRWNVHWTDLQPLDFLGKTSKDRMTSSSLPMGLYDLPNEIIEVILAYTSAVDIVSSSKTCKRFHNIVSASSQLQLVLELAVEGLRLRRYPSRITPCGLGTNSASELLLRLKRWKEGWLLQKPLRLAKTGYPHGEVYGIGDGLYVRCVEEDDEKPFWIFSGIEIYSMWIEEGQQELKLWRRFPNLGFPVGEFSFNLTENLLIITEAFDDERASSRELVQVHLRSLENGETHPAAANGVLGGFFLPPWSDCDIRSSGEIVAVLFQKSGRKGSMYIWNWQTGEQLEASEKMAFGDVPLMLSQKFQDVYGYAHLSAKSFVVLRSLSLEQPTISLQLFEMYQDPVTLELPEISRYPLINVVSDELQIDSPSISADMPLSPFVRDDTAERVIVVQYTREKLYSFILVRSLLRILANEMQSESSRRRFRYPWSEWSPGAVHCIKATEIVRLGTTSVCGVRVGLLCRHPYLFSSLNDDTQHEHNEEYMNDDENSDYEDEEDEEESDDEYAAAFVLLDFNPRPVIRSLSQPSITLGDNCEHSKVTEKQFGQRNIVPRGPPATLRFLGGVPKGRYRDIIIDTDHMIVYKIVTREPEYIVGGGGMCKHELFSLTTTILSTKVEMLTMGLCDLPNEVIETILAYASAPDIVSCFSTCKRIRDIVYTSSQLQLIIELAVEGLRLRRNLPQPTGGDTRANWAAQLLQFKQWKEAWLMQEPPRISTWIPTDYSIFVKRDGLCAQGIAIESNPELALMHYDPSISCGVEIFSLWMEEGQQEPKQWRRHPDLGVLFYRFAFEPMENLLVLLGLKSDHGRRLASVHLRSLDNGMNHPNAREPVLSGISEGFDFNLKISGDTLAVHSQEDRWVGTLSIWNWKTGDLLHCERDVFGFGHLSAGLFIIAHSQGSDTREGLIRFQRGVQLQLVDPSCVSDSVILELHSDLEEATRINIYSEIPVPDQSCSIGDIRLSSFIQDETAERVIGLRFSSQALLSFVLVRPLLRLYAAQRQILGSSRPRRYRWDEWSPGNIFTVMLKQIEVSSFSTPICGGRVGISCSLRGAEQGTTNMEADGIFTDFTWGSTTFALLDFNPRPVIRQSTSPVSEGCDDSAASREAATRFSRLIVSHSGSPNILPARLRFLRGTPEGDDNNDIKVDMNHIMVFTRCRTSINTKYTNL
ncbi:hypothetical protein FRC17_009034 [Serendipita sp. 399]|nr:hypothetical protein FRC17_009034 [Serendipita sp. 399]